MKYQPIYNRLRRIEGQIRGIEEMLSKERSESDIIIQLEAVKSSVASTITSLLESSIKVESGRGKANSGGRKVEGGKVEIEREKLKSLLKMIKKS
jgi:DNA-binding FrmR family transcriptional regulator